MRPHATGSLSADQLFAGGGELGALMRALDWATTPLGPVEAWPQALKIAVRLMLTSRQPMWLGWGNELIYLYNDPYKSIIGGKHPWALGKPTRQVWGEIWDDIAPLLETALGGNEGTYSEALRLIMQRHGYQEETYYTFSYSPIPDDQGGVGGIFCANTDETERIIGERQLALLRDVSATTAGARTVEDACKRAAEALGTNRFDLPFALIYLVDPEQQTASLTGASNIECGQAAAPEHVALDDSTAWPLGEVHQTNSQRLIEDLGSRFNELPNGAWDRPPSQAVALPITPSGETGQGGVLIAALNPYRLFDDGYGRFLQLLVGEVAAAIADAHAYEQERRRAEELAALDQAKTAFFSNVSHEFRTPLTLMLGPLEETLAKSPEDILPENRALVETVHRNALRLLKLVNSLLDFSRIEAGRAQANYQATDLASLTSELASSFESVVESAGLRLVLHCSPLPQPVYVDRDMWEKVVLNLLSNALKFTFEGEIEVLVGTSEDGAGAELRVRDTGTGISAAELPRMFERFHRVEGARGRTHEGSGIGLALVRELVKLHGGTVTVESELDRGSAFIVRVPFGTQHLPQDRLASSSTLPSTATSIEAYVDEAASWLPQSQPPAGRPAESMDAPRVLLADDNADMRHYIRRLLSEHYAVEAVADGQAALEAARARRPDLVLSDVMMPRLDGFGLVTALRADPGTRDIPIILLSARAGEEARVEGVQEGADDYLVKPFSARELLARIKTHIALSRARAESLQNERTARELAENLAAEETHLRAQLDRQLAAHVDLNSALRQATQERDRAMAELRVAHDRLQGVFKNAPALIALVRGPDHVMAFVNEVTDQVRARNLLADQKALLEQIAQGAPLTSTLEGLARLIERHTDGLLCSILLLDRDGKHLRHGAAPGLPAAYNQVIDGITIGPAAGSCGTAAFRGQRIIVRDIASDPLWADYRKLALPHGLRSCWSTPIFSRGGEVLGTFAMYHRDPRDPIEDELHLIDTLAYLAGIAIERERAEEERSALQGQKDEFLSAAAHDLKTPLTGIQGFAQLLERQLRQLDPPGHVTQMVSALQTSTKKAAALIDELLDAARLGTTGTFDLNRSEVELVQLARAVIAEQQLMSQRHELRLHTDLSALTGHWDQARLDRVLANLVGNAIKYSPEGGEVRIDIKETMEHGKHWAVVAVQDHGIGIPIREIDRVFDRFHRGSNVTAAIGGSGIGLAYVREIVQRHGGSITAASEEGRGSTFTVRLPLEPGERPDGGQAAGGPYGTMPASQHGC